VHSDSAVNLRIQREHCLQSAVVKHNVGRISCRESGSGAVPEVSTIMAFRGNRAQYARTVNLSDDNDSLMSTPDIPLVPGPGTRHPVSSGSKCQHVPHVLCTTNSDNTRVGVLYFIA
jgi:hypothetical protein